jgi:hypothetical protein
MASAIRIAMKMPSWWTDDVVRDWQQAREAVRRDWAQTRHDLHLGGHELNQDMGHTLGQAAGAEAIPAIDVANRPEVIATWEDAEVAIGFGYAARTYYGHLHPSWTSELGHKLAKQWKSDTMSWKTAEILVHHGYDVRH